MDYWTECIKEAFEDADINATDKQIDTVASWVEGAYENYGMAHGYDAIPNQSKCEIEKLKNEINKIKDAYEKQLRGVREGVARRRKIDTSQVYIEDDGTVKYDLI